MMNGASTAFGGTCRSTSGYRTGSVSTGFPDGRATRLIVIPLQNEPYASQARPEASTARFGSIAFTVSPVRDRVTRPRSVQWYRRLDGSSVGDVMSPMTELFEPKVEAA